MDYMSPRTTARTLGKRKKAKTKQKQKQSENAHPHDPAEEFPPFAAEVVACAPRNSWVEHNIH